MTPYKPPVPSNPQLIEISSDIKPIQCYVCRKGFDKYEDLSQHEKEHHELPCTFCEKMFFTKTELKDHVVKCHVPNSKATLSTSIDVHKKDKSIEEPSKPEAASDVSNEGPSSTIIIENNQSKEEQNETNGTTSEKPDIEEKESNKGDNNDNADDKEDSVVKDPINSKKSENEEISNSHEVRSKSDNDPSVNEFEDSNTLKTEK